MIFLVVIGFFFDVFVVEFGRLWIDYDVVSSFYFYVVVFRSLIKVKIKGGMD